jgi:hypothetical protein
LQQLGNKLKHLRITKVAVGWDLEMLEAAVGAAVATESDSDDESIREVPTSAIRYRH